jgi:hypothetical protein
MAIRKTVLGATGAVITLLSVTATPALAATETVSSYPGDIASCNESTDRWAFTILDVGGDTGFAPPSSISVKLVDGSTKTVPLGEVQDHGAAEYPFTSATRSTANATAVIDTAWNPDDQEYFYLSSGPCAPTKASISVPAPLTAKGASFPVSGRVTASSGAGLAGRKVTVRLHSHEALGKGITYGPFTTGGDGRFTAPIPIQSFGPINLSVEYNGASPLAQADLGSSAQTVVFSLPGVPPAGTGRLTSSAGATLAAGATTVVSGSGFDPHSAVAVAIYSTPTVLAVVETNDEGAFSAKINVPTGLTGGHTLVASGRTGENLRYLTLPVTVEGSAGEGGADGGPLPVTGPRIGALVSASAALIVLGGGLWLLARRRRARFTAG